MKPAPNRSMSSTPILVWASGWRPWLRGIFLGWQRCRQALRRTQKIRLRRKSTRYPLAAMSRPRCYWPRAVCRYRATQSLVTCVATRLYRFTPLTARWQSGCARKSQDAGSMSIGRVNYIAALNAVSGCWCRMKKVRWPASLPR